jgi:predicted RNase H-like HicB family nuclease
MATELGLSMEMSFTAIIQQRGRWWIGWIEETAGVDSQGDTKAELIENLRSALEEAIEMNRSEALAAAAGSAFERVPLKINVAT